AAPGSTKLRSSSTGMRRSARTRPRRAAIRRRRDGPRRQSSGAGPRSCFESEPRRDVPTAVEGVELSKRYGNVTAIESLTFSVRAGSLFGFLGSNGSGKSTTIACLSGLTDPTSGIVRLFGKRFDSSSVELKRRIGVMPENLGLFDY